MEEFKIETEIHLKRMEVGLPWICFTTTNIELIRINGARGTPHVQTLYVLIVKI